MQSPCLVARPDLAAYVAAFEGQGWTVVEGEDRAEALLPPAEIFWRLLLRPKADGSQAEVEATLGRVAEWAAMRLGRAAVLARGDARAMVEVAGAGAEASLTCVIAAPDLPEVDELVGPSETAMTYDAGTDGTFADERLPSSPGFQFRAIRLPRPEGVPRSEAIVVIGPLGAAP